LDGRYLWDDLEGEGSAKYGKSAREERTGKKLNRKDCGKKNEIGAFLLPK
jgi:hypothetical protein